MAVPAAERRYIHRLSQLSHNYRGGPLTPGPARQQDDPLAPGSRLPFVRGLRAGGKAVSTLDLLLGSTKHTLFVLAGDKQTRERAGGTRRTPRAMGRGHAGGSHQRPHQLTRSTSRQRSRAARTPLLPLAARATPSRTPRRLPRLSRPPQPARHPGAIPTEVDKPAPREWQPTEDQRFPALAAGTSRRVPCPGPTLPEAIPDARPRTAGNHRIRVERPARVRIDVQVSVAFLWSGTVPPQNSRARHSRPGTEEGRRSFFTTGFGEVVPLVVEVW